MSNFTTEITLSLLDKASPVIKTINKSLSSLKAATEPLNSSFASVGNAARNLGSELKYVALAGVGLIGSISALSVHNARAAEELQIMSQKTGVTTDQLQRLGFVANHVNVSNEELAQSFKFLNKNIAEAGTTADSDAATAFNQLGISVRDAAGHFKTADKVMLELADAFSKSSNTPLKVRTSIQLMGRAGSNLIPVLNQGSAAIAAYGDEFERLGHKLTGAEIEKAGEFNRNLKNAWVSLQGLTTVIGQAFIPILDPMVRGFTNFIAANKELVKAKTIEYVQLLSAGIMHLFQTLSSVGEAIGLAARYVGGFGNLLGGLILLKAGGLAKAFLDLGVAIFQVGVAMLTTPFGLFVTALGAITYLVYQQTDGFKGWGKVFVGTVDEMEKRLRPFAMLLDSVGNTINDDYHKVIGEPVKKRQYNDYQPGDGRKFGNPRTPYVTRIPGKGNDIDAPLSQFTGGGAAASAPTAEGTKTGLDGLLAKLSQMNNSAQKTLGIKISLDTTNKVTGMSVDAPPDADITADAGAVY